MRFIGNLYENVMFFNLLSSVLPSPPSSPTETGAHQCNSVSMISSKISEGEAGAQPSSGGRKWILFSMI